MDKTLFHSDFRIIKYPRINVNYGFMDKTRLFKILSKNVILKCLYIRKYGQKCIYLGCLKKRPFSRNVDIFRYIGKWSQKSCFILKCWYLRTKHAFFFKLAQKPRFVDIFVYIGKTQVLKVISKKHNFFEMLIFLDKFDLKIT